MRSEALRWFMEAEWDLETAAILHREKRFNAAAFYAHQAAWGHSVRELLERYFRRVGERAPEELMVCARELDRHYIPSRYPNALPSGTPHEAYDEETSKRALEAAKRVVEFARERLGASRAG